MEYMKKILVLFLLAAQCGVIFCFSAQPAENSSKISEFITRKIVLLVPIIKQADTKGTEKMVDKAETFVRKMAHFTLFLFLGIFAYLAADSFFDKRAICIALLFCLLYAVSDELHQLFSPGRSCEFRDVCIDFAGSLCGVCAMLLIQKIIKWRKHA